MNQHIWSTLDITFCSSSVSKLCENTASTEDFFITCMKFVVVGGFWETKAIVGLFRFGCSADWSKVGRPPHYSARRCPYDLNDGHFMHQAAAQQAIACSRRQGGPRVAAQRWPHWRRCLLPFVSRLSHGGKMWAPVRYGMKFKKRQPSWQLVGPRLMPFDHRRSLQKVRRCGSFGSRLAAKSNISSRSGVNTGHQISRTQQSRSGDAAAAAPVDFACRRTVNADADVTCAIILPMDRG